MNAALVDRGTTVPNIDLVTIADERISLDASGAEKIVLLFYRGYW